LVKCPYFTLEYLHYREPFTCGGMGGMQVIMVLHGRGRLWTADGVWQLKVGDTLLLPADLPSLACHPEGELGLLLSSLPGNR
jgi:quercetin dioxygenase-like cupin family protein